MTLSQSHVVSLPQLTLQSKKPWRIPAAWRAKVGGGHIAEWQVYADHKPVYELLPKEA